jgi:putative Holliday junction resolvase
MRTLGVDPGSRRVGLSLSDEDGTIASPHATLEGQRLDEQVAEKARALGVERIVVGLPLTLEGREGEAARRARRFAARVAELSGLPVTLWDERLTTRAAEQSLLEGNVRRGRRRELVDRVAAALLLQSYLDAQRERA